jgi:hypothetical protein
MIRLSERQYAQLLAGKPITGAAKWGNEKTTVDTLVFDSKFEAKVYQQLRIRERIGEIRNLRRQVEFPIEIKGIEICVYVADFIFEERTDAYRNGAPDKWEPVIADAKSTATRREATYRIKAKLMRALYQPIREILSTAPRHRRPVGAKLARRKA